MINESVPPAERIERSTPPFFRVDVARAAEKILSRRGIVLIVVVALLAMLALMGTIFILSAASDKQAVYASNTATSLNLAQSGVLSSVVGTMLSQTLDQNGHTLALGNFNSASQTFTPDSQIARTWDCPRAGNVAACTPSAPGPFFQTVTGGDQTIPTQPWLTSIAPWEPYTAYLPGMTVVQVNLATSPPTQTVYVCSAAHTSGATFSGSSSNWSAIHNLPAGAALQSELTPYLFDPTDGLYDISYQSSTQSAAPDGVAVVNVPNASVTLPAVNDSIPGLSYPFGTRDGMWNLLPSSASNGARFRFALRITDTSALLNLNTGWIPSADDLGSTDPAGIYGEYPASCPILNVPGVNYSADDTPSYIQNGSSTTIGRGGGLVTGSSYTPAAWQTTVIDDYEQNGNENIGEGGTAADLLSVNSGLDMLTQGGGIFGAPSYTRPMMLAGNTFGYLTQASYPYYIAQPWRSMYTSTSFTRDVAAVNLTSSNIAPPPRLNLNAPISSSNFAALAQQLYDTLIVCGYQPQHACAWLVDYMTYRLDTGAYNGSPAFLSSSGELYVPTSGGTLTATLSVDTGGQGYVGNTAQPFINEVDIELTQKSGRAAKAGDWAVELVNPFTGSGSLNLSNYTLEIIPKAGSRISISLSGSLAGYKSGSNGNYGVVCYSGGAFSSRASSAGDGFVQTSSSTFKAGPVTVELLRSNIGGASSAVVVDTMRVTAPAALPAGVTKEYADESRDNSGTAGIWGCDSTAQSVLPSVLPTTDPGTIGMANDASVSGNPGVLLFDPSFVSGSGGTGGGGGGGPGGGPGGGGGGGPGGGPGGGGGGGSGGGSSGSTTPVSSNDFINIDAVNNIARECNTTGESLSQQIALNTPSSGSNQNVGMSYPIDAAALSLPLLPDVSGSSVSYEVYQAALYFDFAYDPRAAVTCVDQAFSDPAITSIGGSAGEIAPCILTMTTLNDRTTNTGDAISLPNGVADLVRMPGKVNINTADQNVLYTAFSEDAGANQIIAPAGFSGSSFTPQWQMVADTIAYRNRLAGGTNVQAGYMTTAVPSSWYTSSSGRWGSTLGFHSLGDLLLALIPSEKLSSITTLQQRDAPWADVANFLTVRTDTFAVYGYIQALRLNPQWTGIATYQPADWYNASRGIPLGDEGSISTDPTQNAEFILEGSRRFIAIIDRSFCNDGASFVPQIVAIKTLP
ncbi:MAG: hypothetical protein ACP5O1_04565 [Phycisphaerae bacterium]